jgi:hypothetical protein
LIGAAMGFVELAASYYLHALALRLIARG